MKHLLILIIGCIVGGLSAQSADWNPDANGDEFADAILEITEAQITLDIDGCTNPAACNFNEDATEDDGSCLFLDECGVCGGTGIPEGACDCDGNVIDAIGVCGGDCLADYDADGICDDSDPPGCTDPMACNYDAAAYEEDGSCVFAEEGLDCEGNCLVDEDGDGNCDPELAECAPPTAAATFVAAPEDILEINNTPTLQICTGESVTVQDNGSSIDGFTLEQWLWDFDEGDAELVFDGNAITHTYDEPGAYTISLSVGYDNGTDLCTSTNLDPLQVFVYTSRVQHGDSESNLRWDGNRRPCLGWFACDFGAVDGRARF